MAKKSKFGSVKRFGPRYGRTNKENLGRIEALQKKSYKCPVCHYEKVYREAAGIWKCEKCGVKFTSKAYTVAKLPTIKSSEVE